MAKYVIQGGHPLKGSVRVSGSKNAALPILAATLLTDKPCVLRNVPNIADIHTIISMLRALGSSVSFKNHTVKIQTKKIIRGKISTELGCKMRASVLLLGPLVARTGNAHLPYPGGCVLGARPIDTHAYVLNQLGVKEVKTKQRNEINFKGFPRASDVTMPEFSVTATENAIMAASLTKGKTVIRLAAIEPHVQDLCQFLIKLGVKIDGVGSHILTITGKNKLSGATHSITPDYLEVGTFVIAGLLTKGDVTVKGIVPSHLDAFWNLLREMKVPFELKKNYVRVKPVKEFNHCKRLQTNVFPGFPTDLQAPFAVLLTQAKGESNIHETLFDGRFNYFPDLVRMGAKIEKVNPHQAIVFGPTKLKGSKVKSWDIRAGAAILLAALAAKGTSTVTDVHYIDRGYEKFDEKLRKLGAKIKRVD